jgi:hypothetical protein
MVDLVKAFVPLLVTQKDVQDTHKEWDQTGVTDYLNKYRDLVGLADTTGSLIDEVTSIDERVIDLEFKCLVDTELAADATEITTTRNERIVCNNIQPAIITLNAEPTALEEVIIWNRASSVTIIGPINGVTELIVYGINDAPHLRYSVLAGEWGLV